MREQARAHDDDGLGDDGERERVPERAAEDRVVQRVAEVLEPDPLAGERARRRVGEAQVDREDERRADERGDEQHRRRDEERREKPATFRDVAKPCSTAPPRGCHRCHCGPTLNRIAIRCNRGKIA